jgi:peptide/nickel transport system permease protein
VSTPGIAADAPVLGLSAGAERFAVLRRLLRNPGASIGLLLVLVLLVVVIFAPLLAPYDPTQQTYTAVLDPPGSEHLMGTDSVGRDVLSRVLYGARVSLLVGLVPVAAAFLIGTLVGVVAGFYGGRVDSAIMRLTDIGLALPGLLLALVVIAVLGPGLENAMIALGIADLPLAVRVARGSAMAARQQPYVQSGIAIGASDARVMRRYILPAAIPPIVVVATVEVAHAILIAASLSFLGLGAQPPTAEWGSMLAQGQAQLQTAWWVPVFPGLAIVLSVLAINLLGDGLRDVLDPKGKGAR